MRRLVIESFIEEYGAASEYAFDGTALAEVEKGVKACLMGVAFRKNSAV